VNVEGVRLQKILSRAGITSRRKAEDLIREGRVSVNGKAVRELGTRADPRRDAIRVDGKRVGRAARPRIFVLYKPRGVVTSLSDPQGRATVAQFLPSVAERLYPVGRLDYHSEGLLLLTNDGDLADAVMRAGSGVDKTYLVKVRGIPDGAALRRFSGGMQLDGRRTRPARAALRRTTGVKSGNAWVEVTLHEGRRNQIRRMFQQLGHPVQKLRRTQVGPVSLGELQPGQTRELRPPEVLALRRQAHSRGEAVTSRRLPASRPRPGTRGKRQSAR
jgi:23S rRNA pseudouridine2605 synthase